MNLEPREETENEEVANALTHGIAAVFGLVALVLLVMNTVGVSAVALSTTTLYALTFFFTYLSSTLFHACKNKRRKRFFRLIDTCFIFLFILGSNLPFALLVLPPDLAWQVVSLLSVSAVAGIIFKIITHIYHLGRRLNYIFVALYVVMGWSTIMLAGSSLFALLSAPAFNLLLAGGILYTVGVLVYMLRDIPYNHAIWHLLCFSGSVAHFLAIFWYLI